MMTLKHTAGYLAAALAVGALMPYGATGHAQDGTSACTPPKAIPLSSPEPAARLFIDPPLAEPLASRGVVVIAYCAANMRMTPVFGPAGLAVSPRVGHIHVTVDDAPWRWADASGTPVILQGLPPGRHTVLIELVNANHEVIDKGTVRLEIPSTAAARPPH